MALGVVVEGYTFHCLTMMLLYFCQGMVQGTLGVVPLLLLQRHPNLSAADQATLSLPIAAFSLKFLWAPLVDHYYIPWRAPTRDEFGDERETPATEMVIATTTSSSSSNVQRFYRPVNSENSNGARGGHRRRCSGCTGALHRRAQWVLFLQSCMALGYVLVAVGGGDSFLEAAIASRAAFLALWWVLVVLAVTCATQDVAVDAWSVEGLPPANASSAGSLQLVGLMTGITLCYIFVQLNALFPTVCTLSAMCVACAVCCVGSALLAAVLALRHRLPDEGVLLSPPTQSSSTAPSGKGEAVTTSTATTTTATTMAANTNVALVSGAVPAASTANGGVTTVSSSAAAAASTTPPPTNAAGREVAARTPSSSASSLLPQPPPSQLPSSPSPSSQRLRDTVRDLWHTRGLRELLVVLLTKGWPIAPIVLVNSRLVSLRLVDAAAFARYRVYCTVLQLPIAADVVTRVLRRVHAASVIRFVSGLEFVLVMYVVAVFLYCAAPATVSSTGAREGQAAWYGPCVVLPVQAVFSVAAAFAFVANVELASALARRFPRDVGGVLTLLNAFGNVGHSVPSLLCMYGASVVVQLTSWYSGRDTSYGANRVQRVEVNGSGSMSGHHSLNSGAWTSGSALSVAAKVGVAALSVGSSSPHTSADTHALRWMKSDVLVCSFVLFAFGGFLRFRYLLPSVAVLVQYDSAAETEPLRKAE